MISPIPRSSIADAPPLAGAPDSASPGDPARASHLRAAGASAAPAAVRRGQEQPPAASSISPGGNAPKAAESFTLTAGSADEALRVAHASSVGSTPFMAQLIGQQAPQGDQVVSGRGPTSFRKSPVELYEQAHGWARRIEFLFALEDTFAPAAA